MVSWRPSGRSLLLLGIVFGIALWLGLREMPPPGPAVPARVREALVPAPDCDAARMPCTGFGDGVEVRLRIRPGARALEPFPLQVQVSGEAAAEIREVRVRFEMPGMDMGRNRYRLEHRGEGLWGAQVILPLCTTGRRDWLALVELELGDRVLEGRFPFVTR